ncbi:MAG: TolC family protein [Candidatus Ozemobacteraceae bacterium]
MELSRRCFGMRFSHFSLRNTIAVLSGIILCGIFVCKTEVVGAEEKASKAEFDLGFSFASSPEILTLDECLSIAFLENRGLNQTRSKVEAAKAKKSQLLASQLPGVSTSMSGTKNTLPIMPSAKERQETFRASLSATFQPFGRFSSLKRASQATITAADADRARTEIDTGFRVTKAFYDLLLAQLLERVASESVDQLREHRDTTSRLVERGTAPGFNLLRADVQLASAKPILIRATHAISTSLVSLLDLLGVDPRATPKLVGSFPEHIPNHLPLKEDEAIRLAFEQRPDLKAAKASLKAAKSSLRASQQALQPSMQISHSIDSSRGNMTPVDSYRNSRTTTLGLVFPVFDSGLSSAQSKEAAEIVHQAQLGYESVVSAVYVEIRQAISAVIESFEVLESQEKNVEQAEKARSIAEKAYQTGAQTSLDVLDAQLALTQAKTARFQALRDQTVAIAQLEKVLGYLPGHYLESEGGSVNEVYSKQRTVAVKK